MLPKLYHFVKPPDTVGEVGVARPFTVPTVAGGRFPSRGGWLSPLPERQSSRLGDFANSVPPFEKTKHLAR